MLAGLIMTVAGTAGALAAAARGDDTLVVLGLAALALSGALKIFMTRARG
ncbi:hypothetical protein ACX6XY_25810 [Streptomyces sp. O3]